VYGHFSRRSWCITQDTMECILGRYRLHFPYIRLGWYELQVSFLYWHWYIPSCDQVPDCQLILGSEMVGHNSTALSDVKAICYQQVYLNHIRVQIHSLHVPCCLHFGHHMTVPCYWFWTLQIDISLMSICNICTVCVDVVYLDYGPVIIWGGKSACHHSTTDIQTAVCM